jgi:SAM-dependent MidA family methyltransferase
MAEALYHPESGYYARGTRQVGRAGDFFTSVSVGPLFGALLARRFLRHWHDCGRPSRWRIIECGAHDGTLAADVMASLRELDPTAFQALEYAICEPLPLLRTAQRGKLADFTATARFPENFAELTADPVPGIAFGNEVLDALPFHLIEWRDGGWRECRVIEGPDEAWFEWALEEISNPQLVAAIDGLDALGSKFPDGYRTEIRTCHREFMEPLVRSLDSGLMVWIDYGFARSDYYQPQRAQGTLRTFSNHRAGESPLERPGEFDITAHVDFTAVAEAAAELGGKVTDFQNQGAWLTGLARDWLLAQEGQPNPTALREFQTLTHPAQLGARFHAIELSWSPAAAPPDPATLRHRLFG